MDGLLGWLIGAVETVNGWVWSPALVGLCLTAGLYFSLRTRFVQVRRFGEMFRLLFRGDKLVVWVLRIGTIAAVFVGSLAGSGVVWTLGDIGGSDYWETDASGRQ